MKQLKSWLRDEGNLRWPAVSLLITVVIGIPIGLWVLGLIVAEKISDTRIQTISFFSTAILQYLGVFVIVGTFLYAARGYIKDEKRRQEDRYDLSITRLYSEHIGVRLNSIDSLSSWIDKNPSHWSKLDKQLVRFIFYQANQDGFICNNDQQLENDIVIPADMAAAVSLLGKPHDRRYVEARKIDLSQLCFAGVRLIGADLRWIKFSGARFDRAKFEDVRLDNAILTDISFQNGDATDTSFRGATAWGADFTNTTFYNTYWEKLKADGVTWTGTNVDPDELKDVLDLTPRKNPQLMAASPEVDVPFHRSKEEPF